MFLFKCKCGNEWHGFDAGDAFCDKCGEYSADSQLVIKKDGDI